jgi:hypothetical protein
MRLLFPSQTESPESIDTEQCSTDGSRIDLKVVEITVIPVQKKLGSMRCRTCKRGSSTAKRSSRIAPGVACSACRAIVMLESNGDGLRL